MTRCARAGLRYRPARYLSHPEPGQRFPDRVYLTGESQLRIILAAYHAHYNTARPHQGIAQCIPDREHDGDHPTVADLDRERTHRKRVLGGLINEYTRAA